MNADVIYAINPSYRLIKDNVKCVVYRVDDFFNAVDNITIVKSFEAVILAMFNGQRSLLEIYNACKYVFSPQNEVSFVNDIIASIEKRINDKILVNKNELQEKKILEYEPEDFLIPKEIEESCPINLRLSFPLSVNFNVSTECPFSCRYCYHPLNYVPPTLSIERIRTLASELKEVGCESIMLTGGDPFNRKDIIQIMKAFHDAKLKYSISTKRILSKKQIDEIVTTCGLNKIQLSLDSNKIEALQYLIGCNDTYLKNFEEMVKNLQHYGVEVRIKSVLTAFNCEDLYDFLDYVHNVLKSNNIQVVQYGRSGTRHHDSLFPSQEQLDKASEELNKFREEHSKCTIVGGNFGCSYREQLTDEERKSESFFSKRSICNAGRFSLTMLPNGEITVCEQLPYKKEYIIGSLANQSLKECWNSPEMKSWLSPPQRDSFKKSSPCYSCASDKYEICHRTYSRCLRFIWETTGDTDNPDIKCPESYFDSFRIT